jgi:hypothetical protein
VVVLGKEVMEGGDDDLPPAAPRPSGRRKFFQKKTARSGKAFSK